MTTPTVEALLAPIDEANPCGADLSFSSEFDAIQEMRRSDDPTLSQGEWVTALKTADWRGAAAACEELLQAKTKDLRVVGWLAEAWAQSRGYEGLADGVELAQLLCEAFWPGLHPTPDEGDFELRIGALSRLLAQVTTLSRALPVLDHTEHHYSLVDMDSARALQTTLSKARDPESVVTAGKITPEQIQKAQRATPAAVLSQRLGDVRRASAALRALQAVVDAQLGADGPGFSEARTALDDATHTLERLTREAGGGTGAVGTTAADGTPLTGGGSFGAAPGTRAQAIEQLRQVAEFFRRTEPHSPVAYLADRAATWGTMALHDWLRLVLKDAGALGQLEELLGVARPADGGNS